MSPTIATMLRTSQIHIQTFWFAKSHDGFPSVVFLKRDSRRMKSAENMEKILKLNITFIIANLLNGEPFKYCYAIKGSRTIN